MTFLYIAHIPYVVLFLIFSMVLLVTGWSRSRR